MRWKHRIRIGKGNSMKVQLYLGYSVLLAFLAGLIGVFLFLGMRTLVMNQIGQSRLDVLKQVSERSNIVKNSVITISNLYRYDERVLDCLESDKRNFVGSPAILNDFEGEFSTTQLSRQASLMLANGV